MKRKKVARTTAPADSSHNSACELCTQTGGTVIWRDANCRVVLIGDPDYPGYCRVIWRAHVREMTDLPAAQRAHCMRVVFAVEQALRTLLVPDKINLASFGNMAPHLHWHVIPRFAGDAHFPNPVWGRRQRSGSRATVPRLPAKWRVLLTHQLAQIL